jgi:hypothetical protein
MLSAPGLEGLLTTSAFAVCFLIGSAVVALWLDLRFPRLAPATVKATLIHVGVTIVTAQVVFPLAFNALQGSRTLTLVALFGVAFPILTYSLLVAVWVLKLVANASRGVFR